MSPSPLAMSKSTPIRRRSRHSFSTHYASNATSFGASSTPFTSPTSNLVLLHRAPLSRKKLHDDSFGIFDRGQRCPSFCVACALCFDERRKAWIVLAPERL